MLQAIPAKNSYGIDPPQYFCLQKGHPLKWKSASGTCASCKKQGCRSRYQCVECQEIYCLKCMTPPLYGLICGAGHEMHMAQVPYHICDHCSATIEKEASRCQICDFDICPLCLIIRED